MIDLVNEATRQLRMAPENIVRGFTNIWNASLILESSFLNPNIWKTFPFLIQTSEMLVSCLNQNVWNDSLLSHSLIWTFVMIVWYPSPYSLIQTSGMLVWHLSPYSLIQASGILVWNRSPYSLIQTFGMRFSFLNPNIWKTSFLNPNIWNTSFLP